MIRAKDVIIEQGKPFEHCQLGREPYANTLTSIIEAYSDGFVLAVNGKWGTGKTTFMKMWEQSLKDQEYKTIYFNAWENDFTSEPLVAILGELREVFKSDAERGFNKIIDKAYKFSSTILPALAKTAATIVGAGQLADAVEKVSEATVQLFNDEVADYEKKKESLTELKAELSIFVKKHCEDKPLVFIVDELARCRPDYAVEVLEKIKHFFSVDGIVFVLAIDKEQFCNAIRGFYGSENIDSPEYLRRFIDLEYTLPEPEYKNYIKYLYEYYALANFFEQSERNVNDLWFDKEYFFNFVTRFSSQEKLTLRQLDKLFAHTRIVSRMFQANHYVHPQVVFFLLTLKEFNRDIYQSLCNLKSDLQTLVSQLDELLKNYTTIKDITYHYYYFENLFALILKFYSNSRYYSEDGKIFLVNTDDETRKEKLTFTLNYMDPDKMLELLRIGNRSESVAITHYTSKIDLLESLKS